MTINRLIAPRTVTTWLWLLAPAIFLAPSSLNQLGLNGDSAAYFILPYLFTCYGLAFWLQRARHPQCDEYMFRRGKMKFALQKFFFRRCGHCGYKPTPEAGRGV